ncbi:helix-turn-helix domain-containing protein [Hymenobacter jeollabukensis]|uniref:Winged helix-turn-helix transcriptional regulator n=1 Tax=Hymenobacter jeollabukensis TaxID=2025313 RepID=A0A5R8WSX8_9BACT|nr:hypothetical protein [Hymenobacter jeollabukensis]TLM93948.1 hypothetical protein FDY95_07910 [Hymenobacter jeollabukensis]
MPVIPAEPTGVPVIDALAERIARRDQPRDTTDPRRFEPDRIRARIAEALRPLVPGRNSRGYGTMSHICYAFVEREASTTAQLAAAAGVQRIAAGHALGSLVRAGVLRWANVGTHRYYRLTRFGEDWLLALARCETPPAAPATGQ